MMRFHKAERRKGRLRLGIAGPAGSGKTYSALLIAFGIGGRVAMIDTERGSGELYAHLGDYDVCPITPPFTPEKYIEAIRAAEAEGYSTIIIDSLSHAWTGEGGLLDLHGHLADRSGNSWTAWRKVTPKHNQLVEAMLQSPCHVIATMRSKMEYAQVTENGRTTVKKLGMSPIQRDGMEYEFTLFLDLDQEHVAAASKDRTSLFDGTFFRPTPDTGRILMEWLEGHDGNGLHETDAAPPSSVKSHGPAKPPHPPQPNQPEGPTPGNGTRILFAKLTSYGLSKEAYKAYCRSKYNVQSMKELSPSQREEQIRILNSLKNPERLSEFKKILEASEPGLPRPERPNAPTTRQPRKEPNRAQRSDGPEKPEKRNQPNQPNKPDKPEFNLF